MIPFYNSVNGGPPEPITALSPIAWYRYGVGITEAGGLVSAWADQSGNGNDLVQATGTNQPALQSDNSILFDGVDNYLKAAAFTLNQPETIYLLMRQITWTDTDMFCDGDGALGGGVRQRTATPGIVVVAGADAAINNNLVLNTYGVVAAVINGASSVLQVNNTTPTTGNASTNNMSGFTMAARGNAALYSNIQVKEAILFPVAHDAATRAIVITYLATVGGLNI